MSKARSLRTLVVGWSPLTWQTEMPPKGLVHFPRIPDNATVFRALCAALAQNGSAEAALSLTLADPDLRQSLLQLALRERMAPALQDRAPPRLLQLLPRYDRIVLATEYEANRRHNQAIKNAMLRIGAAVNQRGFEIVALKGAAWLFANHDDLAAWRMMRDADVLVDLAFIDEMPNLLASLGFAPVSGFRGRFGPRKFRGHFHLPPYFDAESGVVVEVHRHIGFRAGLLPNQLMLRERRTRAPGLALPPPWCAAFHTIAHWQVQNHGYRQASCAIREIFEISRHLSRDDVDWERLAAHAEAAGVTRQCRTALALTQEFFGAALPAQFQVSIADRRQVARCLSAQASPTRAWIMQELSKICALWACERESYRLSLWSVAPVISKTAIWVLRVLLTPVIIWRSLAIVWGVAAMSFNWRLRKGPPVQS